MKKLLFLFTFLLFGYYGQAQTIISASAQLGYASPQGDGVGEEINQFNVDGGLTYGVDAMYHIMEGKLGLGLVYNGSILAGGDLDAFGLSYFALKGQYRFFPEKFSPFVGLGLGLSRVETPEVSVNGQVTTESESDSGFGIMPTFGLYFGKGFYASVDYLLPTEFTIENTTIEDASLGALTFQLGYRYFFEF